MRIILILLLLCTGSIFATSDGQNATTLSLTIKNGTILDALHEIENQSGYSFVYNVDDFNVNKLVSLNLKNKTLNVILDLLLSDQSIEYKVAGKHIALYKIDELLQQKSKKLTGTVTDGNGEPVIGANVVVKGTSTGTITDLDGKFSMEDVPDNTKLLISFIGYIQQEITVGREKNLSIILTEDLQKLDEVVVVGYGTQTRREITGSVTNVTVKDFNQGFTKNAADLLQGKVAGLTVNSGSGDVTSDATIRLRGVSTLQNDQGPLIVIDNVPGADMSTVSPQDIESISILKDASSAAIYGSRSAGGVILITTKRGSASQSRVSYTGAFGISTLANKPNLMTASKWREYTSTTPGKDGSTFDLGANTDWFDEITRTGIQQDHNVSLSGGGSDHNYRGSISYMKRDGVSRDNYLERYNSRLQFSQRALNDRLKIDITGVATITNNSPTNTRNFLLAYNMIPVRPVKYEDGTWFESREYDQGNPVRNQDENSHINKINNYYGTANISFTIINGLDIKSLLAKSRNNEDFSQYNSIESEAGYNDGGFSQRVGRISDKDLMEWTANYATEFAEHKVAGLIGYSWEEENYADHTAQSRGFITDLLGADDLASGQNLYPGDAGSSRNQSRLISFYARANYSYKEKYLLTATIRRDGSSKFGANNKWGTFPSVSVGWNISQESFMNDIKWLDDLKLRVGYGVTGNQSGLDPYKTLGLYGSSGVYYDNRSWLPAYKISQNANPDLKWEQTGMLNIGLDFSVLDNRLGGKIEWYDKKTSDMLYTYPVPTPPYLYSEMMANVGDMENKGIELTLNANPVRTKEFDWDISINLSHNKNKVTRLSNDLYTTDNILIGSVFIRGGSSNNTHILEAGRPIGQFYGLKCNGIDADGRYIFVDKSGDGEITDPADFDYIGSAQPDLTYGLTNSFRYKNLDFSFFIRGTLGNDVMNVPRMAFAQSGFLPGTNALDDPLTYQLKETPRYSSLYVEDGSFLRLDNMSLGYKFNCLKGVRIYLTAQNVFVITKYKGLDPEVPIDSDQGLTPGVEPREFYPKARTFSIGMNLNF